MSNPAKPVSALVGTSGLEPTTLRRSKDEPRATAGRHRLPQRTTPTPHRRHTDASHEQCKKEERRPTAKRSKVYRESRTGSDDRPVLTDPIRASSRRPIPPLVRLDPVYAHGADPGVQPHSPICPALVPSAANGHRSASPSRARFSPVKKACAPAASAPGLGADMRYGRGGMPPIGD
jgi:hypothetical protein